MMDNERWIKNLEGQCEPEAYDQERECGCVSCWEKYCDELLYEDPGECSKLSRELMNNMRLHRAEMIKKELISSSPNYRGFD